MKISSGKRTGSYEWVGYALCQTAWFSLKLELVVYIMGGDPDENKNGLKMIKKRKQLTKNRPK